MNIANVKYSVVLQIIFLHFTCKIAVILKYVTCHKLSHAAELLYVTINSQIVVVAVIIVIIIGYIVVEFKK